MFLIGTVALSNNSVADITNEPDLDLKYSNLRTEVLNSCGDLANRIKTIAEFRDKGIPLEIANNVIIEIYSAEYNNLTVKTVISELILSAMVFNSPATADELFYDNFNKCMHDYNIMLEKMYRHDQQKYNIKRGSE